ncbi:MAG: glycosyltransferase family 1 protein, partial [Chloroflexota bacterium]|nr:glycosyltransferase family 1 protein [Chloroflexota bacterium]
MPASRDEIAIDASRGDAKVKTGTEWYSYELIRALAALDDRPPLLLYHRGCSGEWAKGHDIRHHQIHVPRLWTHVGLSKAIVRDRPGTLFVPS